MAVNAPIIRTDLEFLNEFEMQVAEIVLYYAADMVNMLARKGAIYGQLVLPPDMAARKRMGGA